MVPLKKEVNWNINLKQPRLLTSHPDFHSRHSQDITFRLSLVISDVTAVALSLVQYSLSGPGITKETLSWQPTKTYLHSLLQECRLSCTGMQTILHRNVDYSAQECRLNCNETFDIITIDDLFVWHRRSLVNPNLFSILIPSHLTLVILVSTLTLNQISLIFYIALDFI